MLVPGVLEVVVGGVVVVEVLVGVVLTVVVVEVLVGGVVVVTVVVFDVLELDLARLAALEPTPWEDLVLDAAVRREVGVATFP